MTHLAHQLLDPVDAGVTGLLLGCCWLGCFCGGGSQLKAARLHLLRGVAGEAFLLDVGGGLLGGAEPFRLAVSTHYGGIISGTSRSRVLCVITSRIQALDSTLIDDNNFGLSARILAGYYAIPLTYEFVDIRL